MKQKQRKQAGEKTRVLFISIKNDARSQIAEGFLKHFAPFDFEVFSAGTLPALELNFFAVQVMAEQGIDISKNTPKSLLNFLPGACVFDYIITICDKNEDIKCPAFSDEKTKKLHWNIRNPDVHGSYEEKLITMRKVRDEIEQKVKEFVRTVIDR
ncbi:MAG: arsenate reductase ArsC [Candidatus Omnitrophica bacterium]|nr:arsenate reductase ArsC [Candidatus Omnitrophota bacterium]MCM8823024.1 arsenate reductase ArsC [Candidatus Omnitrophota bacterium]MCM8825382.1 arsenate reductase ArsC [Candidatus Omnitrophota bacterium]MCM8828260.1 arsenate reductase ArsC [Candidatus Omnitrophota bacterium]